MSDTLISNLFTLSNLDGHAGDEIAVRRAIRPLIQDHVAALHVDAMGNLITHKPGTDPSGVRVLVTAHMDEVGLMVVGHTGEGCLRFDTLGSISDRLLPGLHVRVGREKLPGVIGIQATHRVSHNGNDKAAPIRQLAIDIGAKNKDEAEGLAPVGTYVAFTTAARELGTALIGKAFDDRAGCAILIELLRGAPFAADLHGVFTVQEEVGLRGARVAAYTVAPDVAIALEGTLADDLPKREELKDTSPTAEIGKGPAVTVMDRSYVTPPWLLRHIIATAEKAGLPYQLKQPGISGTEAGATHMARGGVPAVTIAVPCRYIHTPIALAQRSDIENTLALVRAVIAGLTPDLLPRTGK